jgi:hypothetical protein
LQPLHGSFGKDWAAFVGIILALSGVETIANATGVMKLDAGSTEANPRVTKTPTPAILIVMIEVCVFTALLGLAMQALQGLTIANGDVNAPGAEGVRDYMLRYMDKYWSVARSVTHSVCQQHCVWPAAALGRQHCDCRPHHNSISHVA